MSKKVFVISSVILAVIAIAMGLISGSGIFNINFGGYAIILPAVAFFLLNGIYTSTNKKKG